MNESLDTKKLGIIEDNENYYFFRALNMADNSDIENHIVSENGTTINRIRTDRERFQGDPRYSADSELSLDEIFDHIKMHYIKETNCISLSSNANVVSIYGRGSYKDTYAIIKVPKKELGHQVIDAGNYIIDEIQKRIDNILNNQSISDEIREKIEIIDDISSQQELDQFITENTKEEENKIFKNGFDFIKSIDFQSLDEKENFNKNKIIAKMDVLGVNIIPNVSNKFLIQTIGNAFSSLEYIHYKDITGENIIEVPKEIIDIFSLIQQLPDDYENLDKLKQELLEYLKGEKQALNSFEYGNYQLDENEYTIEKMYELTKGDIDFYSASNVYKKSFYLAKSRLRALNSIKNLQQVTDSKEEYRHIYEYLNHHGYGVEPEIFSKHSRYMIKVSETVGFEFRSEEQELVNLVESLNEENLETIIDDPLFSLSPFVRVLSYLPRSYQDKNEYYANAIIDMYDWSKLNISRIYDEQRNEIVKKLVENNCVDLYDKLKNLNFKENQIANILLTTVIKNKDINDIDPSLSFTLEELESFLGYYEVNDTNLVLKTYQVSALKNAKELLEGRNFASVILPTGAGKSFVALAEMLQHQEEEMLYLAPNTEILNQIKKYTKLYIHGKKNTTGKSDDEILKEVFPNLTLSTYVNLKEANAKEIRKGKYDFIVFDELHRTGATEWYKYVKETIDNQNGNAKVLGITATPQRDMDLKDMSDIWAEYFGYSEEEIYNQKHLAINMDIMEGMKSGHIVQPRIVNCEYSVLKDGTLDNISGEIKQVNDDNKKKELEKKYELLRRNLLNSDGIEKILDDNLKTGGKYIVFLPITKSGDTFEDEDGNQISKSKAERVIQTYQNQMKQYIYAGNYLKDNKEKIIEIEKCLNNNTEFSDKIIEFLNNEKNNILLLSKLSNVNDNNILVSKSNEITERIIEKMHWEHMKEEELIKRINNKAKGLVENYSMLGNYSNNKNKKELENFNSSNSNKTKFMFVMNKLNEGVHVDKINGIIWFRALDENSKILYLQQLGRCIYGINSNEEPKEEDRPVVFDLVNNTLKVNLLKGDIKEIRDLNSIKNINDYTKRHGYDTLDIDNPNNKLELYYVNELKRINNTYIKYTQDNRLLDDLDYKRKKAILEIIQEGSNQDLWNKEFGLDKLTKDNNNKKESMLLDLFEVKGVLRDLCDLMDEIKNVNNLTGDKIMDFIDMLNDTDKTYDDKEPLFMQNNSLSFKRWPDIRVNQFWQSHRFDIKDKVLTLIEEGQDLKEAKRVIDTYEFKTDKTKLYDEFVNMLNDTDKTYEEKKKLFGVNCDISYTNYPDIMVKNCWVIHKNEIRKKIKENVELYSEANRIIDTFDFENSLDLRIKEFVRMLNDKEKTYTEKKELFSSRNKDARFEKYPDIKIGGFYSTYRKRHNIFDVINEMEQNGNNMEEAKKNVRLYEFDNSVEQKTNEFINMLNDEDLSYDYKKEMLKQKSKAVFSKYPEVGMPRFWAAHCKDEGELYDEIRWLQGFVYTQEYFDLYGDLNVREDYKDPITKYPLGSFIQEQKTNYHKKEKDKTQLEHEKRLSEICPNWNKTEEDELAKMLNEDNQKDGSDKNKFR